MLGPIGTSSPRRISSQVVDNTEILQCSNNVAIIVVSHTLSSSSLVGGSLLRSTIHSTFIGFTLSTLACIYQYPETVPCFAYSLFGLYAYKLYALQNKELGGNKDAQHKAKVQKSNRLPSFSYLDMEATVPSMQRACRDHYVFN